VIRILLVDDFLPWHRAVQEMFESKTDLKIIAVAADGLEAVQKARQLQPDLILLDIGLPGLNGIEAARQIRELSPNSKILFVTQESSAELVENALRLGAQGYLLKSEAASELLHAVDAVLQGDLFISSRLRHYTLKPEVFARLQAMKRGIR
jgi:DNA-binding NarL/FixJ family response regulator